MQDVGTWGGIAIISDSMLATPEAMDALKKAVSYAVTRLGCISQVVVAAPEVAGRGIVEASFERVYQGLCLYNFFDDYASAKAWTLAQIAQYDAAKS
jgi:CO dehydrogenase/acetyl-CoA synthase beta subunit